MKKILLLITFAAPIFSMETDKEDFFKSAREGNIEKIKDFIINKKFNVNARNLAGDTVLIIAVKNKKIEVVRELLLNGADINGQNNAGQTALTVAIEEKILKWLRYYWMLALI